MASVNKVILLGYLGRDPEVRYTPSGSAVANVSMATSRAWKDKTSGERQEETEWHRLVFYDRLAEVVGEHLHKGSQIYVEGRLRTKKWQDKEGNDRYTTEIVVDTMTMLGGGNANDDGRPPAPPPAARSAPRGQAQAPSPYAQATGRGAGAAPRPAPSPRPPTGFDGMDDDIPF